MTPTGVKTSPAATRVKAMSDKMNKHVETHFNDYLGKILERIETGDRKTFKIVVVRIATKTGGQILPMVS